MNLSAMSGSLGLVKTEFRGFSKNDFRDVLVYLF